MTLEYRQERFSDEGDGIELHPLVGAGGRCGWRRRKAARTLFDNTIAALRAGIEEWDAAALALAVGDTRPLPTRPLPDHVVRPLAARAAHPRPRVCDL